MNESVAKPLALVGRITGPLVVAAVLAIAAALFGLRDTVRVHDLYLESLRDDQNRGKRFTWADGQRLEAQIALCTDTLRDGRSREHERITYLGLRLDELKERLDGLHD